MGRTARGEGGVGHAMLILRPEELVFLRYLKQSKVPLNEFEFSWAKISNIQPQVSQLFDFKMLSPSNKCLKTTDCIFCPITMVSSSYTDSTIPRVHCTP